MQPYMNYYVLKQLYERLEKNPDDNLKGLAMYHSSVGFAQAAIKAKFGIEYSYVKVVSLLVEEKLLNKEGLPCKKSDLVVNLKD